MRVLILNALVRVVCGALLFAVGLVLVLGAGLHAAWAFTVSVLIAWVVLSAAIALFGEAVPRWGMTASALSSFLVSAGIAVLYANGASGSVLGTVIVVAMVAIAAGSLGVSIVSFRRARRSPAALTEDGISDQGAAFRVRLAVRLLIAVAVILLVIAVIGPEVPDPSRIVDFARQSEPPSGSFSLGTDPLGRDNASRVADGVRLSIVFGLGVAALWAGLCVALGLVARQLRRFTRGRTINVIVDVMFTAVALGIAIVLCLDWLDPDAGWFQLAGATTSADYERTVLALTLYESYLVLFVGVGIAVGIWISRTSLPAVHRFRWGLAAMLVLAALAVRAEPFLGSYIVSPFHPPSSTIGALINEAAAYSSTEWWLEVPLAGLWIAMMATFLGGAVVLASPNVSMPEGRSPSLDPSGS